MVNAFSAAPGLSLIIIVVDVIFQQIVGRRFVVFQAPSNLSPTGDASHESHRK